VTSLPQSLPRQPPRKPARWSPAALLAVVAGGGLAWVARLGVGGVDSGSWWAPAAVTVFGGVGTAAAVWRRRRAATPVQAPAVAGPTLWDTIKRSIRGLHGTLAQLGGRPLLTRRAYSPVRSVDDPWHGHRRCGVRHLTQAQRIARLGSWEWHHPARRIICSTEVCRMLAVAPERFHPDAAQVLVLVHPDDRRSFRHWVLKLARGVEQPGLSLRLVTPGGDPRQVHLLGETLVDAASQIVGVVGTVQEASPRSMAIEEIERLAYYDALTELPNRARFHANLKETHARAQRLGKPFAVMFLDLDQFKRINDTLGHAVGDDLLRIVAQRLTRVLRLEPSRVGSPARQLDRDLCRRGGDEFIVLLNGIAGQADAAKVAQRALDALAQPVSLGTHQVFISASIGIVFFPRDGADLDTLLMNADVAMYEAKAQGRNRYSFYEESMGAATASRLSLETELRQAVEGQQFELHYQPQVDVRSGAYVGVEALLRWNHPGRGVLSPTEFITVAEETGLIMPIWEWVLVSAMIQHNTWREMGLGAIPIGVNLSTAQLVDPGLAMRVQEIARIVGVRLQYLELEVTESMLMVDFDSAVRTLNQLRAMGIKIAIDDFGTGYSSLSYLRRLPFDKLKLDQSFTRDAVRCEQDAAITRAIISLAQCLDLAVVAEGVETQGQLDFLLALGCTTMQGYLLGRPVPGPVLAQMVRESHHPLGMEFDAPAAHRPPTQNLH
jgi:diguanylate cyclase (GGDEF)-like protein